MLKARVLSFALILCMVPAIARADSLKVYPGAKLDAALSAQVSKMGSSPVKVYKTSDSFQKVVKFYTPLYKRIPGYQDNTPGAMKDGFIVGTGHEVLILQDGAIIQIRYIEIPHM